MTDKPDLKGIKDCIDQVMEKAKTEGNLYDHNSEQQVRTFFQEWLEVVFKQARSHDSYVDEINEGVTQYLRDNGLVPESHERAVLKSVDPVPSKDGTLTFDITFKRINRLTDIEMKDSPEHDMSFIDECHEKMLKELGIPLEMMIYPTDINDPQMKPYEGKTTLQYTPVKLTDIPIPEVVDYPLPNIPFKLKSLEGKE